MQSVDLGEEHRVDRGDEEDLTHDEQCGPLVGNEPGQGLVLPGNRPGGGVFPCRG
jgi:hypothetical protein